MATDLLTDLESMLEELRTLRTRNAELEGENAELVKRADRAERHAADLRLKNEVLENNAEILSGSDEEFLFRHASELLFKRVLGDNGGYRLSLRMHNRPAVVVKQVGRAKAPKLIKEAIKRAREKRGEVK